MKDDMTAIGSKAANSIAPTLAEVRRAKEMADASSWLPTGNATGIGIADDR
jgi:hypothetical protein